MPQKILLTSFATWKAEQPSNSSDDLLAEVFNIIPNRGDRYWLRQLPVDFQQAPTQVINRITQLQPDWVICCGMAESQHRLSIEARATSGTHSLASVVDVETLIQGLSVTDVSWNAGQFVCNHLYYCVLQHLQIQRLPSQCIFVHVPILSPKNKSLILADFLAILGRVEALTPF